jgi:hypothetical protein
MLCDPTVKSPSLTVIYGIFIPSQLIVGIVLTTRAGTLQVINGRTTTDIFFYQKGARQNIMREGTSRDKSCVMCGWKSRK